MSDLERRFIDVGTTELRMVTQNGKRFIEGYGVLYNTLSERMYHPNYGAFREVFRQGAFRNSIGVNEIKSTSNHSQYLARQKNGTLQIEDREKGIWYSAQIPNTQAGRDALELAERGDFEGSSFEFNDVLDSWREERDRGERVFIREVTGANLFQVGPVFDPAYRATSTSLSARSLDAWQKEIELQTQFAKAMTSIEAAEKYLKQKEGQSKQ